MYELNETATEIARVVAASPTKPEDVVDKVCRIFAGETQEVESDIRGFLNDFISLGIFEVVDT